MDTKEQAAREGAQPKANKDRFGLGQRDDYQYMGVWTKEEHLANGYLCEKIDLGLDPTEEAFFKENGEDNDEDDAA